MKKRLLTVQGPLQYLAGLIAYTHGIPAGESWDDSENVLLLYDFLAAPEIEDDIAAAVRQLSAGKAWSRVVYITQAEMEAFARRRHGRNVRDLQLRLGSDRFNEIYLARDQIGLGSPLLMDTYSGAIKRAYGDSLGLVGQSAESNVFRSSTRPRWVERSRAIAKRLLLGVPRKVGFDEAVLTLPMDLSGRFFDHTALVVPPREHVVACVEALSSSLLPLDAYCAQLCAQGTPLGDRLYLLSNLAASGLSTPEQEIDFYVEVIESSSPSGSTTYIKPHPRSTYQSLKAIEHRLRGRHRMIVIDDERFARMPIELWFRLIRHCEVVPMFSTSAINLKYLYGKAVDMPLNEHRLARYIKSERIDYMRDSDRLIRKCIDNLDHWDRSSALWSGPASAST
ncbi:polysialyltransferase family glycosyltransferase [Paucibacter sp. M5-1]|uniref:polysialyltransferase family glycosyltransferase n=1 Tax=Paucibacter sp. M5-1 TaxID=3015998 RepID=UPI0022B9245E|nr:polysialyltransferase family glycosyltransferase [Paucibacter sp. M5-1]MCZ7879638.1 polysialyltransferase family glycosyltransferase [Paucibacter sp. M5-1]